MEKIIDLEGVVAERDADSWLPLREASKHMGVSAATLRAWADTGRVESYRTPGGHRRFRIGEDDGKRVGARRQEDLRWRLLEHSALGCVRIALETRQQNALPFLNLPPQAEAEHRVLGRKLVRLLVDALRKGEGDFETRVDALGKAYAALHWRFSVKRAAALTALGFFRNAFAASVVEFAFGLGEPAPDQLITWLSRVNELIDRIAVSMLESPAELK
jgi:excisionase family DNA binding protein